MLRQCVFLLFRCIRPKEQLTGVLGMCTVTYDKAAAEVFLPFIQFLHSCIMTTDDFYLYGLHNKRRQTIVTGGPRESDRPQRHSRPLVSL